MSKARRTSSLASAADASTSQILELDNSDEPVESSQTFLASPPVQNTKGKQLQSVGSMNRNGASRLANFFRRPSALNPPPKSAPAKLEQEIIVLDSSDDEETSQAPRDPEVIDITDSDSDSPQSPPPLRALSPRVTLENASQNASSSTQKSFARATLTLAPPVSVPVDSLPPLPPSSDLEQSPVEIPSSPSRSSPLGARTTSVANSTHRSPRNPHSGASPDSDSSDGVLETDVAPIGPDEPSFVLNSSGSSSSHDVSLPSENPAEEARR
ncbi:hypothetical protein FRC07_011955, partial [Ceratobasidium sp. 392]